MKTVFDNYEIFHVWANRQQQYGRNSSRTIFFENDKIYSYGYHYLLGEFIPLKNGNEAVIINDYGYSNTTSKHISRAFSASSHYTQVRRTFADSEMVLERLEFLLKKLANARKPEKYISEAKNILHNHFAFLNSVDKKWIKANSRLINPEAEKNIKKTAKLFDSADKGFDIVGYEKKKELARRRKEKAEQKKELTDFFKHKTNYVNRPDKGEDFIRISEDKERIETTQGVKVSIKEAKLLYQMIKAKKPIHGHKIGLYTIIGLNGVLSVGCHKINKANMEEVGEKILKII